MKHAVLIFFLPKMVIAFLAIKSYFSARTCASLSADACNLFEDRWLQAGDNSFPPFTKSQWLDLSGIKTHHLIMAQDQPKSMVMLHGTGSAAALAWSSSAGKLAESYAIYAPDLPAFGRSRLSWETFCNSTHSEIEDLYADWLANYIDAMDLVKPVVVAHSMGAFFAVKFAKKYPNKLSKLILVDPAGLMPTLGSAGFYFAWLFKLGVPTKQIRGLGRKGSALLYTLFDCQNKGASAYYWVQLTASPTAFGDQVVAKFITRARNGLSGYWNRPALWDLLTAGVPVAFVYGETDNLMPPSQGRVVAEVAMRDASVVGIVPGAWHAPYHIQKGDPFVEQLLRAIEVARLPAPSARLVQELESLDPSSFPTTWNMRASTRTVERFYAHLRTLATESTILKQPSA